MMDNQELHILITGERCKGRSYVIKQKTLKTALATTVSTTFILFIGTALSLNLFFSNKSLQNEIVALTGDTASSTKGLITQLIEVKKQLQDEKNKNDSLLCDYEEQIESLKTQKDELLVKSVNRLDERAKIIESIISTIGVKMKIEEDPSHSGGRFIASEEAKYGEQLLSSTDKYLKLLKTTPFGRPLNTSISSKFGHRSDPFNKKKAFHEGLDFKGKTGDKIRATADGLVKKSAYSKSWGHHIVLDHKNGYTTLFAHLNKRLVKSGSKVERGQVIGHVGTSGRSTGSHLHYEVHLDGRPINPMKFIKISNLSMTVKN